MKVPKKTKTSATQEDVTPSPSSTSPPESRPANNVLENKSANDGNMAATGRRDDNGGKTMAIGRYL